MIEKLQFLAIMLTNDARTKRNERGATAVEYGLMVSLIAAAIVVIVGTLGTTLNGIFSDVNDAITP